MAPAARRRRASARHQPADLRTTLRTAPQGPPPGGPIRSRPRPGRSMTPPPMTIAVKPAPSWATKWPCRSTRPYAWRNGIRRALWPFQPKETHFCQLVVRTWDRPPAEGAHRPHQPARPTDCGRCHPARRPLRPAASANVRAGRPRPPLFFGSVLTVLGEQLLRRTPAEAEALCGGPPRPLAERPTWTAPPTPSAPP